MPRTSSKEPQLQEESVPILDSLANHRVDRGCCSIVETYDVLDLSGALLAEMGGDIRR